MADNQNVSRLIDSLPGLVWTLDAEGRTEFANHRWSEYTGLSPEALMGRGWQQAIHADDIEAFNDSWRAVRQSTNVGHIEVDRKSVV